MSICAVCGKNVPNIAAKIIRGKSGEWVCKECLNRANIGVFKFSNNFITSDQIKSLIKPTYISQTNSSNSNETNKCSKCGSEFNGNFCSNCGTQKTEIKQVVRCSQCGTEYEGNFCPKGCNSPQFQNNKKKSVGKAIAITCVVGLFAFAIIMGILFGEESPTSEDESSIIVETSSEEQEEQIEYIEVTAQKLWNAFQDNEVAADKKYKGEYVKVTGIVADINSKDFLSSANILLQVDDSLFGCIQCNFNNSENAEAISNVQKGQKVTVTGTCGGLDIYNIMISGCELQ